MSILVRVTAGVVIALCFIALMTLDYQDEKLREQIYCHDVALWELDEKNGVPEHERYGHPNYKGIDCEHLVK